MLTLLHAASLRLALQSQTYAYFDDTAPRLPPNISQGTYYYPATPSYVSDNSNLMYATGGRGQCIVTQSRKRFCISMLLPSLVTATRPLLWPLD